MKLIKPITSIFSEIINCFTPDTLIEFYQCPYEDLNRYHVGLGTIIRNRFLDTGELSDIFKSCGIVSKDDMSDLIIKLLYIWLHENHSFDKR